MFLSVMRYFALRPYYLALFIIILLFFWMLSAPVQSELVDDQQTNESAPLPKVQTTRFIPQTMIKELNLYGKSEANSRAIIRAEVAGKIVKMSTEKGNYVKAKKNLVNIEKRNRLKIKTNNIKQIIVKNFDNSNEIFEKINFLPNDKLKMSLLLSSSWMLKV